MVAEQRHKTNCKHDCNEEKKKNVETANPLQVTLKLENAVST